MFTANEIQNAIRFYEVLKKDLHTLLVKGSISPLDFDGEIVIHPYITSINYLINEKEQSEETYDILLKSSVLIENMLKSDLRLWDKTQGIKWLEVAPDHRCETVVMEIGFLQK